MLLGKKNNKDLLTHCKRELVHTIWRILLDEDFVEAYKNGTVVWCFDGVTWRVYPRIFTYSADYPKKLYAIQFTLIMLTIEFQNSCCNYLR